MLSDHRTVQLEDLVRAREGRQGIMFVVSAPSGTGKTSVCRGVRKVCDKVVNSVSYTTRPPRADERDGVDYYFISDEEFGRMVQAGEFAEWAVVHGHKYGTPLHALEAAVAEGKNVTLAIDVEGARQIRARFPDAVLVFLIPPSMKELRSRLSGREGNSSQELGARLQAGVEELQSFKEYDYILVNRDLDATIDQLRSIIIAEGSRVGRTAGC